MYIIGIDIGTTNTKAVAFTDRGEVLGTEGASYPVFDDPSFQVDVIDGAKHACAGQRKLKTVRESYRA